MRRVNLGDLALDRDADDPPEYAGTGYRRLGPSIGAERIGGTVYEMPPGGSICPYHYEHGDEEWLVVLSGTATVRHPEGEDELASGDVVCFPVGPEGAHKVTNKGAEPLRVLMLSTMNLPAVCVYPDSDKIGVFTAGKRDDGMFRRESSVGYWDREQ